MASLNSLATRLSDSNNSVDLLFVCLSLRVFLSCCYRRLGFLILFVSAEIYNLHAFHNPPIGQPICKSLGEIRKNTSENGAGIEYRGAGTVTRQCYFKNFLLSCLESRLQSVLRTRG